MADRDSGTPLAGLRDLATKNPATEKLVNAGQEYLKTKAQDLVGSAGQKLGEVTKQAGSGSPGKMALNIGARGVAGKVKDAVSGLTGRGKGKGSSGPKMINIIEDIDVGVPVRTAYDQWSRYQEFSRFTKGVTGVDPTDETTSNWRLKVLWSNRSWKANVTEQIPDQRIAWTTEGAKGTTKGVVTFHPLGDNLTKILLVMEYYPKGLFEKTGNIWRAQGRRARLDLKHFRRYLSLQGEAEEGWRGEIRDGEVVSQGEEQEQDQDQTQEDRQDTGRAQDEGSDEAEDYADDSERAEGESDQEESEPEESDQDGYDRDDYDDEDESDEDESDEDESDEDEYDEDQYDEDAEDDYDEDDEDDEDEASEGGSRDDGAGAEAGRGGTNGVGERRQRQSGRHTRAGAR